MKKGLNKIKVTNNKSKQNKALNPFLIHTKAQIQDKYFFYIHVCW